MESAEVRQAEIKIPRVLIKWAFLLGLVRLSEPFGRTRRRTPQRWELRVENQERLAKIKRPPHTEKGERDLVRCFAYPPPRCALQDPAKPRWRQREHPPPDDPFLDTPPRDKHLAASQPTTADTVAPTTPERRLHAASKNQEEEKSDDTVTKLVIREKERVDEEPEDEDFKDKDFDEDALITAFNEQVGQVNKILGIGEDSKPSYLGGEDEWTW